MNLGRELDALAAKNKRLERTIEIAVEESNNNRDLVKHYEKQLFLQLQERDLLLTILQDINRRIIPGECDSIDSLKQVFKERDEFKTENLRLIKEATNAVLNETESKEENKKLRERVEKLRKSLKNITITQCPHFKVMKQTCTCIYDEAFIALYQDDEVEKQK